MIVFFLSDEKAARFFIFHFKKLILSRMTDQAFILLAEKFKAIFIHFLVLVQAIWLFVAILLPALLFLLAIVKANAHQMDNQALANQEFNQNRLHSQTSIPFD